MQNLVLFFLVLWQQRFQCLQSYQVPTGQAGDFASLAHIKMGRELGSPAQLPEIGTANTRLRGKQQADAPLGMQPPHPGVSERIIKRVEPREPHSTPEQSKPRSLAQPGLCVHFESSVEHRTSEAMMRPLGTGREDGNAVGGGKAAQGLALHPLCVWEDTAASSPLRFTLT